MNVTAHSNIGHSSGSTTANGKLLFERAARTAHTAIERSTIANTAAAGQQARHECRTRAAHMPFWPVSAKLQSP